MQTYTNIECKVQNNLLHIIFNSQGSSVNTLCSTTLNELDTILSNLMVDIKTEGVVFESAKPNCFIAGADINEIKTISDEGDAHAKASVGQSIINKISKLKVPTYAIINGACMGGGLELALACDVRIATTHEKTKLALPEVNLGFIPGFGGTQRLPRTVSLQNALDLTLTGKTVDSKKAKKIKLVHDICHPNQVYDVLASIHHKVSTTNGKWLQQQKYKASFVERLLTPIVFKIARKNVIKITKGKYPAPLKAIDVIKKTHNINIKKGLEIEAKEFAKLASSDISKNLVTLFFTNEALKKEYNSETEITEHATIIGSGVMGGGIAFAFNNAKLDVRMKDISMNALALGYKQIKDYYKALVKKRRITQRQADINLHQITSTTSFDGIQYSDVVIEAVVEDIAIKHAVLQDLETKIKKGCIIATNTSSLRVEDIAQPLARKENVVGMHFFNPVNKMPLVEVVKTKHSSNEAISKIMQLARKCGKVAIPVGDCNGFVVNRILLPFMNEALLCLEESGQLLQIDKTLKNFGMPMGAFELADEIGLDVCYKVSKILHNSYGERMKPAQLLEKMFKQLKLLGKKGGEGFYKNGKTNKVLEHTLKSTNNNDIIDRTMLIMVNEAARILEEGYIKNPHYLDMCMIMGAGFPAFRGGILKYADSLSLENVHTKLNELSEKYGDRFTPCQLIKNLAKEKTKFYEIYKL
jgi:3-hydroxyacyl-CoA dehydrogenase / enoyl-CoA hydratase / 3-hydroxybutyryl-CoA epimerase